MTNYTTKQLSEMLATEIKSIAKNEFKLALSSNGKRFTKEELVSSIMKEQSKLKRKATMEAKKATNEPVQPVRVRKLYTQSGQGNSGKTFSEIYAQSNLNKTKTIISVFGSVDIGEPKGCAIPSVNYNNPSDDLNYNKVETIVLQASKLLKDSFTNELTNNIQRVKQAIEALQQQVKEEKKNMFQNNKRNIAIQRMSVMIKSYEKKVV